MRYGFLLLFVTLCFPVKAWEITAVRDAAGALAFCRVEVRDSDSPLTLLVALSAADEVNVGIKVPDAGFTKGEGYDVTLAIDNAWRKKVTAETALADMLLVRLGKAPDFLAALAKGKNFELTGEADATTFPLTGSKAAVETLRQCVTTTAKEEFKTTNDLQPAQLPEGLAALLQQAGIKAQPVALPDTPARMVDYAWVAMVDSMKSDGGFIETRVDGTATLASLVDTQLARYEKQCKQKTKTERGKVETYPTLALQTATMKCGDETGAFVFYKTDTNLFATIIHRARNGKSASVAQQAVADVVRRLARND